MVRSPRPRNTVRILGLAVLLFAGAPGPAMAACQIGALDTLHLDEHARAPVMAGTINGKDLHALLDTGATFTVLTHVLAERAGLELYASGAKVYGIGGESTLYSTQVERLAFGPLHADAIDLNVVQDVKGPWDAIVGVDVLFNHDLEVSLAAHEARVIIPTGCRDAFLAYWNPDASVVPMSDVSAADHRQIVTVQVNGTELRALVDSGASSSLIDRSAARLIGLDQDESKAPTHTGAGGIGKLKVDFWIAPVTKVVLGRETIRDTRIMVASLFKASLDDQSASELSARNAFRAFEMVLGQDFLRSHRVLFARSQERFYFSYIGGPIFAVQR
jgi:predicted aspartyl protease